MMRFLTPALLLALLLLGSSEARGHTSHEHGEGQAPNLRSWRNAQGLMALEASFVLAREGQVLLSQRDGSLVWIPLCQFSHDDRSWVEQRMQEIQALNQGASLHRFSSAPVGPQAIKPHPIFVTLCVLTALGVIAGLAFRARRQAFALPLAVILAAPLCMLAACSAPREVNDEEEAKQEGPPPSLVADFQAFKDHLKFRWTKNTLYIDSNGLPDHPMMIGITNWQQQVPLPQPYLGKNAWQIPLKPKLAEKPISARNALFRGAIALAVNGVPIFNALNNRGEDAFLCGELDEFGGHCGKGDDYHYHIAPLHLEKSAGKGKPIAYALDGFPLFGLTDEKLDEFNGRFDAEGHYRYHASKTYPYINGGMRGVVEVRGDGIEPQPRAGPIRPPGSPLRGAKITGFSVDDAKKHFSLKYEVKGERRQINYKVNANSSYTFVFIDGQGKEQTATYTRKEGKGKKDNKKGDEKKKKGKGPDSQA